MLSWGIVIRRLVADQVGFLFFAVLQTMMVVETFSLQGTSLELFCKPNANVHIRLLILASIGLLSQLHYL
jgi:hypothetical protein